MLAASPAFAATRVYGTLAPNTSFSSGNNPAGVTDTAAARMLGLAKTLTPSSTGLVEITILGDITHSAAGGGVILNLMWGTGAAPANNAVLAGTNCGQTHPITNSPSTTFKITFSVTCHVSSLTLGTQIWTDLAIRVVNAGTVTASTVSVVVKELH